MEKHRLEHVSLLVLFIAASTLLFFVFAPFFSLLSLAAVFAVLLHRPYERLSKFFGGSRNSTAGVTVAATFIFIIIPLVFFGGQIFQEAQNLYANMSGGGAQFVRSIQDAVQSPMQHILPGFTFNINAYVGNGLTFISNNLGALAYRTIFIVAETFLMLVAFFFFLRDGRSLVTLLVESSPIGRETTREMLNKMYATIESVLRGTVLNALIRWFFIWVAFALFHIPHAILWSSLGAVVGAIPGLGTPFAFIPTAAFLYMQGDKIGALGLVLFGLLLILLVDNILTSYFFGKGLAVSPLFVLFSILGGVAFFGPLGFILGPLALSVFLSVVHVYSVERNTVV
jgi:predicted PurR-regulated permease PerM